MTKFSKDEMRCLGNIAGGGYSAVPPCSSQTMDKFRESGLVEHRPTLALPLEMRRPSYQVTASGRRALVGFK